ncbi:MAG: MOSC domain-containing protein [Chloroflexota bacterium]|nr:MOSC domain-containing protein [Chloroflexota bacterium]
MSRLSITPVRSFALQHPDSIELGPRGVADDRRYSLHTADGRLFDATKRGSLVQLRAQLDRQNGHERLSIELPSGEVVADDVRLDEPTQLEIYGRSFTARPVIGPWAEAVSAWAGTELRLYRSERLAHEMDRNAVSIVSEASVEELARQGNDGEPVDSRRFRMLIEVAGAERPHQEDEWMGREVGIGEAVVRVTRPDPRCVITTQHPDTGKRDFPTLHVIRQYRGLREGRKLDFGVYADVVVPGRVSVGDAISPM